MKKIISWERMTALVLATTGLLLPVIGHTQGLPPGEGMQKVLTACTACHGLDNITNPHKKLTAQEWETYLYDMVARGAAVHKDEIEVIRRYLVDNFAVEQN